MNNYDLVLTVFHERQLQPEATAHFEELLREEVSSFVEAQLLRHYAELIQFVKDTEPLLANAPQAQSSSGAAVPQQAPPTGVDVAKMEQLARQFAANWKEAMDRIHQYVMGSFTNFNNGMEILKQVLTQLLLYYTRFQKVIHRSFPNQPPPFTRELVSNATILYEIKQYSKSF